ncbi:MAG: hypothetical protein ACYC3A_04375 [Halothiobacillus sp.]
MKMKLISTAVAAGLGLGMMGAAQAAYINSQGTGQVLLYPYYTANSGNDTYVQVTNTSAVGKVVKVRFVESKNSQEVLDFNLYLSPHDVWAGAVTATANGAKLVTQDNSCTVGAIPKPAGQPFVNFQYTGDSDNTIGRTREGHIELIGMSDIVPGSPIAAAITHVNGVPPNCGYVANDANNTTANGLTTPTGGLYGYAHLVNVAQGTDSVYDATAVANVSAASIYSTPGTITPNLSTAMTTDPILFNSNTGTTTTFSLAGFPATPSASVNAFSSMFMTRDLMNDYVVDPAINAGTDWVVTFPTKNFYVNNGMANATTANPATPPFKAGWNTSTSQACEPVSLRYYDREEQSVVNNVQFSPAPTIAGNALCYEANVISFNGTNVLGSSHALNLPVNYTSGWMDMQFNAPSQAMTTGNTQYPTLSGLPAVGFADIKFSNGNVGGLLSNYSGLTNHKGTSPF